MPDQNVECRALTLSASINGTALGVSPGTLATNSELAAQADRGAVISQFIGYLENSEIHSDQYSPAISAVHSRSHGYVHRVFNPVANRVLHLQSRLEYHASLFFTFSRRFRSILEGVALPPELTCAVAADLKIGHHYNWRKRSVATVTVDFINTEISGGRVAYDVKPLAHLARKRVKEKLHIAAVTLGEVGIPYFIITDADMPKTVVDNMRMLDCFAAPFDPPPFDEPELTSLLTRLRSDLVSGISTIREAAQIEYARAGTPLSRSIRAALWCMGIGRWVVNLEQPLGPDDPVFFRAVA